MTKIQHITVSLMAAVIARDILGMVGRNDKNVILITIASVRSQLEALERAIQDDNPAPLKQE